MKLYAPMIVWQPELVEKKCVRCGAVFQTRGALKIRCAACQAVRTRQIAAKRNAKAKAKRRAARGL